MRSLGPLFVLLLCVQSAACIQIGDDVTGQSASADMDMNSAADLGPPCGGVCEGLTPACVEGDCVECGGDADCKGVDKPVCDAGQSKCVECMRSDDCASGRDGTEERTVCDTVKNVCVGCVTTADCPMGDVCGPDNMCVDCIGAEGCAAPLVCDDSVKSCVQCIGSKQCDKVEASTCKDNMCTSCTKDEDCTHIPGMKVCDAGICRGCTVATEAMACGSKSCNPITKMCTQTDVNTVGSCGACKADSECDGNGKSRCIPLNFGEADSYCLLQVDEAPNDICDNGSPPNVTKPSVSQAAAEEYCSLNEAKTSCEAVLNMKALKPCAIDSDCGPKGACKTYSGSGLLCTIECEFSDECLAPRTTCQTDGSATKYCLKK